MSRYGEVARIFGLSLNQEFTIEKEEVLYSFRKDGLHFMQDGKWVPEDAGMLMDLLDGKLKAKPARKMLSLMYRCGTCVHFVPDEGNAFTGTCNGIRRSRTSTCKRRYEKDPGKETLVERGGR